MSIIGFRVQSSELRSPQSPPFTTQLDLTATAISLLDYDGLPRDLCDVLLGVLDQFDRRWKELLEGRFDPVTAFRERCYLTGKTVAVEQPGGQTTTGLCAGL